MNPNTPTVLRVPAPPRSGREWLQLIVIYLVGVFGFIISGSVYCTLGAAIEFKHNVGQPTPRSLTYIDDGIVISPSERIDESREQCQCIQLVVDIFGPDGVNEKAIKTWAGRWRGADWRPSAGSSILRGGQSNHPRGDWQSWCSTCSRSSQSVRPPTSTRQISNGCAVSYRGTHQASQVALRLPHLCSSASRGRA